METIDISKVTKREIINVFKAYLNLTDKFDKNILESVFFSDCGFSRKQQAILTSIIVNDSYLSTPK